MILIVLHYELILLAYLLCRLVPAETACSINLVPSRGISELFVLIAAHTPFFFDWQRSIIRRHHVLHVAGFSVPQSETLILNWTLYLALLILELLKLAHTVVFLESPLLFRLRLLAILLLIYFPLIQLLLGFGRLNSGLCRLELTSDVAVVGDAARGYSAHHVAHA